MVAFSNLCSVRAEGRLGPKSVLSQYSLQQESLLPVRGTNPSTADVITRDIHYEVLPSLGDGHTRAKLPSLMVLSKRQHLSHGLWAVLSKITNCPVQP